MQVKVTARDISHGFTNTRKCPLRHALVRVTHTENVQVGVFHVWINHRPYKLPQAVSRWVLSGIAGMKVRPIEFDL